MSPQPDAVRDRAIGALVGLAVGDAVGTTLEFQRRDSYRPLTDMVGGGPFSLAPGEWTDDTSMALCLADSLIANGDLDNRDLIERFVRWWQSGENSHNGRCFDIGITTQEALNRFRRNAIVEAGGEAPDQAGNGSLMRLSPVAIRWWHDAAAAREASIRQSRTTHAAPMVLQCCAAFAEMLCEAIATGDKESVLRPRAWTGEREVADILGGGWRAKSREAVRSSGYVLHSLEAALWCVGRTADFRAAILLAANLGEDADTTAAITGQLAGAIWGLASIPPTWIAQLAWRERIVERAETLFASSGAR